MTIISRCGALLPCNVDIGLVHLVADVTAAEASSQTFATPHLVHVLAVGPPLHDERVADADVEPEGALLAAQATRIAAGPLACRPPQPLVPGFEGIHAAAEFLVVLEPASCGEESRISKARSKVRSAVDRCSALHRPPYIAGHIIRIISDAVCRLHRDVHRDALWKGRSQMNVCSRADVGGHRRACRAILLT